MEELDTPPEDSRARTLPAFPRDVDGPILRAGFVGSGANRQPGFIFCDAKGETREVPATKQNEAKTKPRGFLGALAQMWAGGNR
jgi:hypothetical protein